ncbi:MAG: PepSY-associated TM helix domain-containing protein [Bacteroidota bacterium]
MKLKALPPRLYNAIFHTHTVSGIVIGFALFVIFYAGAIALFMGEMYRWENPMARFETVEDVDYDKVVQAIEEHVDRFAINKQFSIIPPDRHNPLVMFYGSLETEDGTTERFSTYVHPISYEVTPFKEPTTHMGRTLYELHFFHQIPVIGLYLAGFVSFFFLFAIITGILIHWKNLVNKFYAFTVQGKWKQIWTNGHTVLGIISLPFQTIYAVTGALLGLSLLLLAPSAFLLFNGDTNEIIKTVRPDLSRTYDEKAKDLGEPYRFNDIYEQITTSYPNHEVKVMFTQNYGKEDGTISVRIDDYEGITGDGTFVFQSIDGALLFSETPYDKPYSIGAYPVLIKLHYATFGGVFLKIIYFILAMLTCYIISSGVMIWRTARDNPRYTDKQRRFHHRVTKVYLAITLGMFPAVALIFLANKLVPTDWADRTLYVNGTFFIGWLLLSLIGLRWNDLHQLNRNYLLIGGLLGLMIPIVNGAVTGDWIWNTLLYGQYYVFSVDLTWLIIAQAALILGLRILPKRLAKSQQELVEQETLPEVESRIPVAKL